MTINLPTILFVILPAVAVVLFVIGVGSINNAKAKAQQQPQEQGFSIDPKLYRKHVGVQSRAGEAEMVNPNY